MMKRKIEIFDTTLRDGEQAAGTRLGPDEKVIIARQLADLGVDVIEAGFPCSSPKDREAVERISREVRGPVICGLTRAVAEDIDICGRALAHAPRSRIHTGLGVSDIHILNKFRDGRYGSTLDEKKERVIDMAVTAVTRASQYTDDIEFYAEDASRADKAFLFAVLEAVIDAGATVINIPDTTGYAIPEEYGALIGSINRAVTGTHNIVLSVHCHNDLGMAVANTLAAVVQGASQIEGTINGIGERAGNAALEEIIMALHTRHDVFSAATGINTRLLYRTSCLVADLLGLPIPANKAVTGKNAFAHSSGIHVDGVLKERGTYEIMKPEDIGIPQNRIILTARTGRAGLYHRLNQLGCSVRPEMLDDLYHRFVAIADTKQEVDDDDLRALCAQPVRV